MDESKFGQIPTPEPQKPKIELTSSQKEVVNSILKKLKEPLKAHSRVILLEGLSGVGKSSAVETLQSSLAEYSATVVESDYGIASDIKDARKTTKAKNFIVPVLANKKGEVVEDLLKTKIQIESERLLGMSVEETEKLAQALAVGVELKLPLKKIIEYSMGVPLLLYRMIRPEITEEMALSIAVDYLKTNRYTSNIKLQDYLKIPISEQIFDFSRERGFTFDFYSRLPYVLKHWEEALEKDNTVESPFFVAPESIEIYNKMFKSGDPFVELFASEVNPEDQKRFEKFFPHYHYERNSRIRMFGGEYRKLRIESRGKVIFDTEGYEKSDYFPQKDSPKSIYFLKHDHPDTPAGTALDCWAVESFLQQRGIAYEAHNPLYGRNYRYNPETKHIEFIEESLE